MPESHGIDDIEDAVGNGVTVSDDGPLAGFKVIEFAGIGPGPYAAMLLADMGADVIRIERSGPQGSSVPPDKDVLRRNRRSVVLDIRKPEGRDAALALIAGADVVMEGFRPGVMERLGLGPEDCWAVNQRIVFGRMTGWGQTGPLANAAGHDIGYIAITGALGAIGRSDGPVPPLNLVGDFGGGSTFLVIGILAACWEASRSGRGQVVDAAIVDGASSLTGLLHGMIAGGIWRDRRGSNMLDGGMPWYDTYETSDHQWMAVGALEPQFYAEFVKLLGVESDESDRRDPSRWSDLRERFGRAFASRTRAEWADVFEGTDACVAPVLGLTEAASHAHLKARETYVEVGGVTQPAPAPRFGRTASGMPVAPPGIGQHTREVLEQAGLDVDALIASGAASAG